MSLAKDAGYNRTIMRENARRYADEPILRLADGRPPQMPLDPRLRGKAEPIRRSYIEHENFTYDFRKLSSTALATANPDSTTAIGKW
jgi:hypothetical protein